MPSPISRILRGPIFWCGSSLMPQKGFSMTYEEFKKQSVDLVSGKLGDQYTVRIFQVKKNNGLVLDNLCIRREGDVISPCIYLQYYFGRVMNGLSVEDAADEMIAYYQVSLPKHFDPEKYFANENIRRHLACRLVNTKRNSEFLKNSPHVDFLDLSLVFYLLFDDEEIGSGAITLRNENLEDMGIMEDELLPLAMENMQRMLPADFMTIGQLIRELRMRRDMTEGKIFDSPEDEDEDMGTPLYVLTNSRRSFGAVWMSDPDTLSFIGEHLEDDYYILPSSVHECMILPASFREDACALMQMVTEINESQVAPEEVLSDNVYFYDRKEGRLRIAD